MMNKVLRFGGLVIDGYPFYEARYANGFKCGIYSAIRKELLKKHDTCWYCGIKLKEYSPFPQFRPKDDQATIEHLRDDVFRIKDKVYPKVLACYRCNFIEGKKRNKAAHKALKILHSPNLNKNK